MSTPSFIAIVINLLAGCVSGHMEAYWLLVWHFSFAVLMAFSEYLDVKKQCTK